jgi:hypothetical protein
MPEDLKGSALRKNQTGILAQEGEGQMTNFYFWLSLKRCFLQTRSYVKLQKSTIKTEPLDQHELFYRFFIDPR